jgi:hypothetical protein
MSRTRPSRSGRSAVRFERRPGLRHESATMEVTPWSRPFSFKSTRTRIEPKAPPREVKRVRVARDGAAVWCDITGLDEGGEQCAAMASPIDDSGDGNCYLITGGSWGLRMRTESGEFGEPYIVLGGDGKDLEFR